MAVANWVSVVSLRASNEYQPQLRHWVQILMTELLSQLAYAKHRGVTHGAVAKAIKSGRLKKSLVTGDDGKLRINPTLADKEWASNTSQAMQRTPAETPAAVSHKPDAKPKPGKPDAPPPEHSVDAECMDLNESRALKERYNALLAQLDYKVKAGILIDAAEARRAAFNMARKAREMLNSIADRIAPVVAGTDNQFECHSIITAEIRRVLDELSKNPLDAADSQEVPDAGN